MNKTIDALKLAEELAEFTRNICLGMNWSAYLPDEALAAIREALADHIASTGKMVSKPVDAVEVTDLSEPEGCDYCKHPIFAGTKCNNCGRVTLAEPVKQEHSEQYWLHEINNARAEGYEKGRASCKHDERMLELGVPVQPVKQEPVGYTAQSVIDWLSSDERTDVAEAEIRLKKKPSGRSNIPLYAAPVSAKREWVELTVSDLDAIIEKHYDDEMDLKAMILDGIAAFKEKNT